MLARPETTETLVTSLTCLVFFFGGIYTMISIDLLWTKITQFGEIGLAGLSA